MTSHNVFVDLETVPVKLEENGREQVRRIITRGRHGLESFSFHMVHFDGGMEKDMSIPGPREIVWYVVQGSATISWDGGSQELRPGIAWVVPTDFPYRHVTGPLGLTTLCAVSPPSE